MTIGEKIKKTRTENGLTQEELASKMMVSRQAITKWEADKGIPDVSNLKLLAQLLNVSVDYLLDDGVEIDINVIRETIDLSKYGKAVIKKKLTNKLMLEKYPDAEIRTLLPEKKKDKVDKGLDFFVDFFTPLCGLSVLRNSLKLLAFIAMFSPRVLIISHAVVFFYQPVIAKMLFLLNIFIKSNHITIL